MLSVKRDSSAPVATGRRNGSKKASFEIRKASQSHAFDWPAPGEGRNQSGPAEKLRVVSDMQVGGEKADSSLRDEVCNRYAQALGSPEDVRQLMKEHIQEVEVSREMV